MTGRSRVALALAIVVTALLAALVLPTRPMPEPRAVLRPLGSSSQATGVTKPVALQSAPHLDRRTGPAADRVELGGPAVLLISDRGLPIADATVKYSPYIALGGGDVVPKEVRSDKSGVAPLKLVPPGAYLSVSAEHRDFASAYAYVWAEGVTEIRMHEGALVSVALRDEDRDLVGGDLLYDAGGSIFSRRLDAQRTVLGRLSNVQLTLLRVGTTAGPAALNAFALPATGEITVEYTPKRECRVEFQAEDRLLDGATYVVGLAANTRARWESRSGGGALPTVSLPVGTFIYVGATAHNCTRGSFEVLKGATELTVHPVSIPSATLEVTIPRDANPQEYHLYVLPAGQDGVRRMYMSADLPTGVVNYPSFRRDFPEGRRWPHEPEVHDNRLAWTGVPRDGVFVAQVKTSQWGLLSGVVAGTSSQEALYLTLERPTVLTVRASPPTGSAALQMLALHFSSSDEAQPGPPAAGCRMRDGVASVTGLAPGVECRFTVDGGGMHGEGAAIVADGISVDIPLAGGMWSERTVRIEGSDGRPLSNVRVTFQDRDIDGGIVLRTDANGLAHVSLPREFTGSVILSDDRFAMASSPASPDGTITLVGMPVDTLFVRNDGAQFLAKLDLVSKQGGLVRSQTVNILHGGLAQFDRTKPGEYRLVVKDLTRSAAIVMDGLIGFHPPQEDLVILPLDDAR